MLSAAAHAVYRAMLQDGSLGVSGLCERLDLAEADVRSALDELTDAALLDADGAGSPARPWLTLAGAIAREEGEIRVRAQHLESMRRLLEAIREDYETGLRHEQIVAYTTVEAIQSRLEQLALSARIECVSFNPGRAHKPSDMEASKPLNQLALERGVGIRCIYADSFRHDPGTLGYARWLTELGGQVRTMPLVPHNLIIVDASVAILSRTPGKPSDGAVEVSAPGVVEALAAYFDAVWTTAAPFGTPRPSESPEDVSALTRQVLGLLAAGATDESAAHRLGISARTVRRLVAKAMDDLGAQSRFQAGVMASEKGWLPPVHAPAHPAGSRDHAPEAVGAPAV